MTDQPNVEPLPPTETPPAGPPPVFYPPAPGYFGGPTPLYSVRTHAELNAFDLFALMFGFFGVSIVALLLGMHSNDQAKKIGLKMHAVGMVGLIFGALGTAGWTLLWVLGSLGSAMH